MTDLKDKFVVEYSVKGRAVHIQPLVQMLQTNLTNVLDGVSNDYIPVAIADSHEEAMRYADEVEAELKKRGQ